jgi:hypothetical protein
LSVLVGLPVVEFVADFVLVSEAVFRGLRTKLNFCCVCILSRKSVMNPASETRGTFFQLDNGTYGLVAWYPDLKRRKTAPNGAEAPESETDDEVDAAAAPDENDSGAAKVA